MVSRQLSVSDIGQSYGPLRQAITQAKALQQLGRQDIAYRVLAYKFSRIIRLAGGQIDTDGNITDMGMITMEMIEIGKNGYRFGYRDLENWVHFGILIPKTQPDFVAQVS